MDLANFFCFDFLCFYFCASPIFTTFLDTFSILPGTTGTARLWKVYRPFNLTLAPLTLPLTLCISETCASDALPTIYGCVVRKELNPDSFGMMVYILIYLFIRNIVHSTNK